MTRLINADALSEKLCETTISIKDGEVFQRMINDAPTVDAVEVVRCKDCKYWCPHTQCGFDEDNDEYHDYCGLLIPDDDFYAYTRKPDDYCSYGECREESEVEG